MASKLNITLKSLYNDRYHVILRKKRSCQIWQCLDINHLESLQNILGSILLMFHVASMQLYLQLSFWGTEGILKAQSNE